MLKKVPESACIHGLAAFPQTRCLPLSVMPNLQSMKLIDVEHSIDVGMVAKSAYSFVQQTRLEDVSLSRKARIAHHGNPCDSLISKDLYTYII
jgi:hypothetical protein